MGKRITLMGICLLLPVWIMACGGGGGGGGSGTSTLSGTVLEGPVKQATVTVTDQDGNTIGSGVSGDDAKYTITLSVNTAPPYQITVTGGTDLVTGETLTTTLTSLVTDSSQTTANVSTLTTLIHKAALAKANGSLGQVTATDVDTVKSSTLSLFGFGVDSEESTFDPLTTPLSENNIASVTVASEAVGELIRRVAGTDGADQEKVFAALGEDMVDGRLDGKKDGSALTSELPAGTTGSELVVQVNLQSAQIAVEVINDSLQVTKRDGSKLSASAVKSAMSDSMVSVVSTLDGQSAQDKLSNRTVSSTLKNQGVAALESAATLASDPSGINALKSSFENLSVGESGSGQLNGGLVQSATNTLEQLDSQVKQDGLDETTLQQAVNHAPQAEKSTHQTVPDTALTATLTASDFDGDGLIHTLIEQPGHGEVTVDANGSFTYTPGAGFSGTDAFQFRVNDGTVDSAAATVTIVVVEEGVENSPPNALADDFTALPGEETVVTLEGFDPDGDPLTFQTGSAGKGTVTVTDAAKGTIAYTAATGATGEDTFTFTVTDGAGEVSEPATVTVTLLLVDGDGDGIADTADNCPLVANADQKNLDGDGYGDSCDVDDDGDGVEDDEDHYPFDKSESRDTDGDGTGDNADADDDGDGVPDDDDAFPLDDQETTDTDGDGTGDVADADDDGDGVADGSDPFPLDGNETMDTDGDGIGNTADGDDDGDGIADDHDRTPLEADGATDLELTTEADTAISGTLSAPLTEGAGVTYAIVSQPVNGTVTLDDAASGAFTYTPIPYFRGVDRFTFSVGDGTFVSDPGTVEVMVTALPGDSGSFPFPDDNPLNVSSPLGVNTADVNYWETELKFIDVMKRAYRWYTTCVEGAPDCNPPAPAAFWDTLEQDELDLDEQGWVRSLPAADATDVYYRSVYTNIFWEEGGTYPTGQYIVLYDGEGTIKYGYDSVTKNEELSTPGRDVLDVGADEMGIRIEITRTDPENYIRNIRVILPGGICGGDPFTHYADANACPAGESFASYETLHQTLRFYPHFLRDLRQYRVLRTMGMLKINENFTSTWAERGRLDDAIWSETNGVPPEILMELANAVIIDPWFSMPVQADDDYIRQFALMAKARLRPELTIYLELANELWNDDLPDFPHGTWVQEQAVARWPDATETDFIKRMNWQGMRSAQMCSIWREVFGDQSDRIKCVVASQVEVGDWFRAILDCPLYVAENGGPACHESVDAMAIITYFGYLIGTTQFADQVNTWPDQADGGLDTLFTELLEGGPLYDPTYEPAYDRAPINGAVPEIANWVENNRAIAQEYGLELIGYEGGQHLGGPGSDENNTPVQNMFQAANRDPRMVTAYERMLNIWKDGGGQMLAMFQSVHRQTKWGSFGLKAYQDQPRDEAIKFDAVMDFIEANPCWWAGCQRP